jgi:hypothetical protein
MELMTLMETPINIRLPAYDRFHKEIYASLMVPKHLPVNFKIPTVRITNKIGSAIGLSLNNIGNTDGRCDMTSTRLKLSKDSTCTKNCGNVSHLTAICLQNSSVFCLPSQINIAS